MAAKTIQIVIIQLLFILDVGVYTRFLCVKEPILTRIYNNQMSYPIMTSNIATKPLQMAITH